ncbi:hypothetical protein [Lentilactobacillus farraginis]|uniref:Uncharacterized protein n=1 Tax=Lentilactobacillus farraginis DSM 18382 = JCM 14108 TaxID=1423743 RepID=X0PAN3_9LACO|nr:hypothetical protein [Lentilactobacillus farraginis]KRM09691.1 hypothetical protein FD41_GL002405 [Lentilactobacillus farraginis DSM 18382 = JCM 14108]GAF36709.1 hypothetical protein JCM14108_1691 [Lentilactobacillus farraginis DSM 18382 = JCM 14108]
MSKQTKDEQLLNEFLENVKEISVTDLLNHALYEKDPAKKAVFKALYDYVIDERQTKIINQQKGCII